MLIKYYNNVELAYANRKRYRSFSFEPFNQEQQKSVLLGDGANTQIKTSKNNICNYVTIDGTRWYVTSYIYTNGGQVILYLQRDVVGEFGFDGCFGKIERGYTDSFIKYRKELSLNEILKSRKPLIPNTLRYGNYKINDHKNELWGVLYFTRPTGINPNTGKEYEEQVNINIPAFAPKYVSYPVISDGSKFLKQFNEGGDTNVYVKFIVTFGNMRFSCKITFLYYTNCWRYKYNVELLGAPMANEYDVRLSVSDDDFSEQTRKELVESLCQRIAVSAVNDTTSRIGVTFPVPPSYNYESVDYSGLVVKDDTNNCFYRYTSTETTSSVSGGVNKEKFLSFVSSMENGYLYRFVNGQTKSYYIARLATSFSTEVTKTLEMSSGITFLIKSYTRTLLNNNETGNIVLNTSEQLVDEPYSILVFPLFDCVIKEVDKNGVESGKQYIVGRQQAFMIFNTVIQYLSGENPYIVDAQIYPYCPVLTGVAAEIENYPFFKVSSNSYIHNCSIQLLPSSDVKKEYIERVYSIVSPEQSSKFNFNFYDYINTVEDQNGINMSNMTISIKTSLKPFGIISSAVIQPTIGSLVGMTYESDLRGSQPTSNGFECSLSSNAFETYKRQNSNYQQIFKLQQDELEKAHQTERANEVISGIVNTITATAMGAIGGAAMSDGNSFASAAAGGVAGGVVAAAHNQQYNQNEKLREFEVYQQQQSFDLQIGTIKNLPNSINRISSFNEIILKDFWFVVETYECSEEEKDIVDNFIKNYGYSIGVFSFISTFYKESWFLKASIVSSNFLPNLHNIATKEFMRGIYIYDTV